MSDAIEPVEADSGPSENPELVDKQLRVLEALLRWS